MIPPRTLIGCLVAPLALAGCPDPGGELDEFVADHCAIDAYRETEPLCGGTPPGVEGGCEPAPAGELDGAYLFALTPAQSPTKPAPFVATVATADGPDGVEITLTLGPLDASDRSTPVPPDLGPYGPFLVEPDGTFTAELGVLTIPSKTNPVGSFVLTANVVLDGRACAGAASLCGVARGAITAPLTLPLDGSTWSMSPAEEGTYPEPPIINCAGDKAAPL